MTIIVIIFCMVNNSHMVTFELHNIHNFKDNELYFNILK